MLQQKGNCKIVLKKENHNFTLEQTQKSVGCHVFICFSLLSSDKFQELPFGWDAHGMSLGRGHRCDKGLCLTEQDPWGGENKTISAVPLQLLFEELYKVWIIIYFRKLWLHIFVPDIPLQATETVQAEFAGLICE